MTQKRLTKILGWMIGIVATVLYLFTMESDVSFWDCGEFIATSYSLGIGHPPGAPFYQLLAHAFTWMAMGNVARIAWWSNALSAVSGGVTAMMLFWTIAMLLDGRRFAIWGALIGALCYTFCDTAWFSTVESEVYSLAMAISSIVVWAMLRWARDDDRSRAGRWLLLIAFLLGLGICVHQLTLLTTPALLLIYVLSKRSEWRQLLKILPLAVLLFIVGLSPYLIIPIRANANPPINSGHPNTVERFQRYISRDQYEKAPVWPRMWRHHRNEDEYAASWAGRGGNLQYYGSYQLWYMYGRYLLWNFSGRYDDRQGMGAMQKGQFITGVPFIDRALVGTSAKMPQTLPHAGHNVYFMLPLLLGLFGACFHRGHSKQGFWTILTLFLMGGVVLNIYLNHPCYEPRERDYAYILSFYAFAIWIGVGAALLSDELLGKKGQCWRGYLPYLLITIPALMAFQNWDDHNRSNRHFAADTAHNILDTCDKNAILFTAGDNDTFPLWFAQHVEGYRPDVRVENISLMGGQTAMLRLISENAFDRPVYFSHYAYNDAKNYFSGYLGLVGFGYRLMPEPCDSVLVDEAFRHVSENLKWRQMSGVYVDEISSRFIDQYNKDLMLIARNLLDRGDLSKAEIVLGNSGVRPDVVQDPHVNYQYFKLFSDLKSDVESEQLRGRLVERYSAELGYYQTVAPRRQRYIYYHIQPRTEVLDSLRTYHK